MNEELMRKLGVDQGDPVMLTVESGHRFTVEGVGSIDQIRSVDEASMLLSMFNHLASNHYYFLAEFGFTDKVKWRPQQYEHLMNFPAFKWLNVNSQRYKAFKALYSQVESDFVDFSMNLSGQIGIELQELLNLKHDENFKDLVETVEAVIKEAEDKLAKLLQAGIEKADVVIGSGTFFSATLLPIEKAFLVSGVDVGSYPLRERKISITVNPFLLFWLISSFFQYKASGIEPSPIPITLSSVEELEGFVRRVPVQSVQLKVYSPSKLCVEALSSEEYAKQWVKKVFFKAMESKRYLTVGDFLLPFTAPSIVQEIKLITHEEIPYLDSTPYGLIPYKEGLVIPEVDQGTEVVVTFYTNPLFDRDRPLLLDTNVITLLSFPYKPTSSFFKAFMEGREILLPAVVVYELKRKFNVGKERSGMINALSRLYEMNAIGLLKMRVIGELTFQPQLASTQEERKEMGRDFRDALILMEAIKHNAVLFTNDVRLREIAILLGVPSISYNSLLDDTASIIRERRRLHKSELIDLVKQTAGEVRGEEYTVEEIEEALSYLRFSGRIRFDGDYIEWLERPVAKT